MGILSSNRCNVGFDEGYADAIAGRPPSYLNTMRALREGGFDSYVDGYMEGYRNGCYDRVNKENHN